MSGLLNRSTKNSLPLRSSSIYTDIKGFTARTTAILTYYNDNRTEIEGLFVLPVDHGSAIVDFECVVEGHYIYADVRDITEADSLQPSYDNDPSYNGVFNISIGRIPPWILIEIQVTVVCEITVIFFGDALKYTLPQTFSPKLASKLNDESNPAYTAISTLGYTFQLEVFIEAPCLLCGVQSNTHPIQVDAPPLSKTGSKIKVTLPEDFEPTNEIFELLMFLCRPREPYIIIEQPSTTERNDQHKQKNPINNIMNNSILMLSYSPDISNFQKELDENLTNQIAEFILIFQSFSEHYLIKDSFKLFIKSLPSNCYFNLICVGSNIETLFEASHLYSLKSIEQAMTFISTKVTQKVSSPSQGLLEAIKWIYDAKSTSNIPRQAFIVSEGEQPQCCDEIIELARKRHHLVRFFNIFLGSSDVSIYKSLSSITNGNYYHAENVAMVTKQIITCLKAALKPAVTNLNISWILPDAYDVIYTPENLPVLYLGNRLNLYAILDVKEQETNLTRQKPSAESINSIKEFWFEDYDFVDDFTEVQNACSSHDVLSDTDETHQNISPPKSKDNISEKNAKVMTKHEVEHENEVFLTDEEAVELKNKIGWPKRLSVDRVHKWRVSRNPENSDMDNAISDTDSEIYLQYHSNQKLDRRKKSSSDGIESLASSNSYGSNLSCSSHFLPFPGYPTRLSSCRSVEARSPHMPKLADDAFHFSEFVKEKQFSAERLYSSGHPDEILDSFRKASKPKGKKKLTQALIDEHVNTHLLDQTNEKVIYRLIEGIVIEKRSKLFEWVNVQEEMTQCTWPLEDTREKIVVDTKGWRDSGIGHRSSSEPRTSDLEDELYSKAIKKSSSSYLLFKKKPYEDNFETKSLNCDMTGLDHHKVPHNVTSVPDILETKKSFFGKKKSFKSDIITPTSKSVPPEKTSFKKRMRAKSIWNSLVDKMKNLTSTSTEKSGEATFYSSDIDFNTSANVKAENKRIPSETSKADFTPLDGSVQKDSSSSESKHPSTSTLNETKVKENEKLVKLNKKVEKSKHRVLKTRPLIENSRTISTSSMIEIGQTEIGDIDSLHLLPSQALIYLSGNFGNRKFKRIIPFQMDFASSPRDENTEEFTIHQLAAKSIIRDLEIQMDEDLLLENNGRNYIKTLVGDVSRSAHILSKHTTVVMLDDRCEGKKVLSMVKKANSNISDVTLQRPTYLNINSVHDLNEPLYEIQREKKTNDNNTKVYHAKLILKSPQFENHVKVNEGSETLIRQGYMKLVDLMTAEGFWETSHLFAEILTVNYSQLRESCPFADISVKNQKGIQARRSGKSDKLYDHIWTTTLALVWVHTYWEDLQEEWILIDEKARKWLNRKKLPTGFTIDDIFVIAQQTLKILKGTSRKSSMRK